MASEFERIRWILEYLRRRGETPARFQPRAGGPVSIGPGDDAAAWRLPAGHAAVLTVDTQLEGVHFRHHWLTAESVGRRAVTAAASDLAAMAARPGGVLISLTLPPEIPERYFRDLFRGIHREASSLALEILGGNLSGGPLGISITAVGHGRADRLLRRQGSQPGDAIYVTGHPGRARIGRALLESGKRSGSRLVRDCLAAFTRPRARIREALELVRRLRVHSMIDLSDGLAADLCHLLEASTPRLGARLDVVALESLPESRVASGRSRLGALCRSLGLDPLGVVLEGGEDYELLFTASPRSQRSIERCLGELGLAVTRLGTLESGASRIELRGRDGQRRPWAPKGFDHFCG